jgi:hypothetical protein
LKNIGATKLNQYGLDKYEANAAAFCWLQDVFEYKPENPFEKLSGPSVNIYIAPVIKDNYNFTDGLEKVITDYFVDLSRKKEYDTISAVALIIKQVQNNNLSVELNANNIQNIKTVQNLIDLLSAYKEAIAAATVNDPQLNQIPTTKLKT